MAYNNNIYKVIYSKKSPTTRLLEVGQNKKNAYMKTISMQAKTKTLLRAQFFYFIKNENLLKFFKAALVPLATALNGSSAT